MFSRNFAELLNEASMQAARAQGEAGAAESGIGGGSSATSAQGKPASNSGGKSSMKNAGKKHQAATNMSGRVSWRAVQ